MSGHGHVTPNPDGSKARCGGPSICRECQAEAGRLACDGQHVAYIHTRTPGPVKVAVCSCGWEGNPHATATEAIQDRTAHYQRRTRVPTVRRASWACMVASHQRGASSLISSSPCPCGAILRHLRGLARALSVIEPRTRAAW